MRRICILLLQDGKFYKYQWGHVNGQCSYYFYSYWSSTFWICQLPIQGCWQYPVTTVDLPISPYSSISSSYIFIFWPIHVWYCYVFVENRLFYNFVIPYLSLIIFTVLNSALSGVEILQISFDLCYYGLLFSILLHLIYQRVSFRQHLVGSCLCFIYSDIIYSFFLGGFRTFSFKYLLV